MTRGPPVVVHGRASSMTDIRRGGRDRDPDAGVSLLRFLHPLIIAESGPHPARMIMLVGSRWSPSILWVWVVLSFLRCFPLSRSFVSSLEGS